MIDFYRTPGGRRFIDGTIPDLVRQVQRVADALDRLITLAEASTKAPNVPESASPREGA